MNANNRLDRLLAEVLKSEPSTANNGICRTIPSLTFAEHDYYPLISPPLPPPLPPPRRDSSCLKHRRRHQVQPHHTSGHDQQHQPLLNSSTLDDLFQALTLECEQYLAASSYQNKTYGQLVVHPSSTTRTAVDSNDDDYENLHSPPPPPLPRPPSNYPSLKTSIEVVSPQKRQVVSISVSSKLTSPSPVVPPSRTYPLLTSPNIIAPPICRSSEDDSMDISSSSTNRKRRRRARKQQLILSNTRSSSSSSSERTETSVGTINEKKPFTTRRSCSTDPRHHQQRVMSIYDNSPSSLTSQKVLTRRVRRRDVSLQQPLPIATKHRNGMPRLSENLCSPLSVLLTSTRSKSDFVGRGRPQQQQQAPPAQRRSRRELVDQQPSTILDRMHQRFYRPSPMSSNNSNKNNSIPNHRIPSYPVY